MSDLFHEKVSDAFIDDVFRVAAWSPQHTFQILTKRPERFAAWVSRALTALPTIETWKLLSVEYGFVVDVADGYKRVAAWPLPNVWLGVSVEDQPTADERIPLLLQTPAAVRFVSYEPALAPVDFRKWIHFPQKETPFGPAEGECSLCGLYHDESEPGLDWLIAGGESGPQARPSHPDWFRQARDQCGAAGVPFFFKQWGEWAPHGTLREDQSLHFSCSRPRNYILDGQLMDRAGKRRAGRLLDGREWNEFPSPHSLPDRSAPPPARST